MTQMGEYRPEFRTNRRAIVGGLGLAGAVGLATMAGSPGVARAFAQDVTPAASTAEAGTIRVIGRGALPMAPDAASITVGVDVSAPTLADAQAEAAATMETILATIAAQGIPSSDVQTSTFSVYPVRAYDPQTGVPGEVTGFQVTIMVNVKVSDVAKVGELLDAVVAARANNVYGVTFFIEDPGEVAAETRNLAIQDARAKARDLAEAAGLTLGRIVAIGEAGATVGPLFDTGLGGGQGAAGPPIAPGTSSVTASVEVVFEIGA